MFQELPNENSINTQILSLTQQLCYVQSDWTMFWRYRQMVLNRMLEHALNGITAQDETTESVIHETEFEKKLSDELYMTYQILIQSPKSYIAWSHRRYCLLALQKYNPDIGEKYIQKDIKLTQTMLTAMTEAQVEDQGRNFHCWDHRRLLLKMGNVLFYYCRWSIEDGPKI